MTCDRRWKGHKCVRPTGSTDDQAPVGTHAHQCLCGRKWVSRHPYWRDKYSGAGNCWCGRHEGARTHG